MRNRSRIIIGLNSGTSADGVDAAAIEVTGRGPDMRVRVLGMVHVAYEPALRERVLAVMAPARTRTEEVCRLDADIGAAFADAAERAVRRLGLRRVDLVGSHGQTVCHLPPDNMGDGRPRLSVRPPHTLGATLQLGDPAPIAARINVPVVSRFRQSDVAVGGQGAPLVPWTDYVLFRHPKTTRVIQNIGGIANLTYLPASGGPEDVVAFDTGPGNMVIDELVRHFSNGRESFDRGGRRAARGRVSDELLARLLEHPYFLELPPKSCGREQFGEPYVRRLLRRHAALRLTADDWIATATVLTAWTIWFGIDVAGFVARFRTRIRKLLPGGPPESRHRVGHRDGGGQSSALSTAHGKAGVFPSRKKRPRKTAKSAASGPTGYRVLPTPAEVVLCGGGARNRTLVRHLAYCLAIGHDADPIRLITTDDLGVESAAKECVSFAMLAAACMDRVPANLPQVTGAARPVVLGTIGHP